MELNGRSSAHGKSFERLIVNSNVRHNYVPVILFLVLYGVAKVMTRIPIVKLSEMDFVSRIPEIVAIMRIFFVFVLS